MNGLPFPFHLYVAVTENRQLRSRRRTGTASGYGATRQEQHSQQASSKTSKASDQDLCESAQFFESGLSTPDREAGRSSWSWVSRAMPGAGSSPHSMQTISWPHMVHMQGIGSPDREVLDRERVRPTVGSWPTSCVIPAVSPTEEAIS
jgi:hypothetical protein